MTRVSGFVCKDCGEPFSMDKREIEFYENKGLEQPKRCPGCRKKRREAKMIDYKKLTADLIKARIAAEEAAKGDDGGTANLDTMTIELPKAIEKKVIEAVKAAGLHTRGRREWIGPRFFILPPKCGQGNSRARAVEAMTKVMREAGWNVLIYYQMD